MIAAPPGLCAASLQTASTASNVIQLPPTLRLKFSGYILAEKSALCLPTKFRRISND